MQHLDLLTIVEQLLVLQVLSDGLLLSHVDTGDDLVHFGADLVLEGGEGLVELGLQLSKPLLQTLIQDAVLELEPLDVLVEDPLGCHLALEEADLLGCQLQRLVQLLIVLLVL